MVFLIALIAAIDEGVGVFGQRRSAPTDCDVMDRSGGGWRDGDDTSPFSGNDFIFDAVAFLFARIPAFLFSFWSLHRLFRGVDQKRLRLFSAHRYPAFDA